MLSFQRDSEGLPSVPMGSAHVAAESCLSAFSLVSLSNQHLLWDGDSRPNDPFSVVWLMQQERK